MKTIYTYLTGSLIVIVFFTLGVLLVVKNSSEFNKAEFSSHSKGLFTLETFQDYLTEKRKIFRDRTLYRGQTCQQEIKEIYDEVASLKLTDFDQKNIKESFNQILKLLFSFRIEIRKIFQDEYHRGQVSKECAFAHRRLFRTIRVVEDFVGMVGVADLRKPALDDGSKNREKILRAFEGQAENFLHNEDYATNDPLKYIPQSGDVLLSRGSATVSAAIARITDEDSNFSHIGIVYIDPKTKKVETIEAHIEKGTVVADISEYKDNKVRALVFRFNDPSKTKEENANIAHEAASKARAKIKEYNKKFGSSKYPNVCYDFTMNVDNPINIEPSDDPANRKCLFCSEVVSLGYSLLDKKYKIPTFFSLLNPKNRKFIEDIGVNVKETFAPADIEIDPYFDLVLEWRDYHRIHQSHRMDAALTAVYSWMDDYNYQFFVPRDIARKTEIGYLLRRIPIFDKLSGVSSKFPINLPKSGITAMQLIDLLASTLYNYLEDEEKKAQTLFTTLEMITKLNSWREKDLADYQSMDLEKIYETDKDPYKSYRFHSYLRAKK